MLSDFHLKYLMENNGVHTFILHTVEKRDPSGHLRTREGAFLRKKCIVSVDVQKGCLMKGSKNNAKVLLVNMKL